MLKTVSSALCNIIFPHICLACKKVLADKNKIICNTCEDNMPFNRPPFCLKCGICINKIKQTKPICMACQKPKENLFFDRAYSVFIYHNPISSLICLFKYKDRFKLAPYFGQKMIEFIKNYHILNNVDLVVPVPLHKKRMREREFNQAQTLAEIISQNYNLDISLDGIKRIHMHKIQSTLDKNKRFENIKGAFKVEKANIFKDKNVLLIDDVFTTGATLREAAFVLKESGAKTIKAFTLARACPDTRSTIGAN